MNTYFLRLLNQDKERKKNRATIFRKDDSWIFDNLPLPIGCQVGDAVISPAGIFIRSSLDYWFKDQVPVDLEVSHHRFNPRYWQEGNVPFFLKVSVARKIMKVMNNHNIGDLFKVRIGRHKYKFVVKKSYKFKLENYIQYYKKEGTNTIFIYQPENDEIQITRIRSIEIG
jgi:hypothetical protein